MENYLSEIDRLENKLTKLRERQLEAFVKSLELEDLQISGTKLTRHMKRNRSMVPGATRVESSHMGMSTTCPATTLYTILCLDYVLNVRSAVSGHLR